MQSRKSLMKDSVIHVGGGMETKAILESLSTGARVRLFCFRWELEEATQISDMFDIFDDMRGIDQKGDNMTSAQVYGTIMFQMSQGTSLHMQRKDIRPST